MYQRILVPVDGSALSDRAIAATIGRHRFRRRAAARPA
jgi:nucleotide-binding universal stress UspA family protein